MTRETENCLCLIGLVPQTSGTCVVKLVSPKSCNLKDRKVSLIAIGLVHCCVVNRSWLTSSVFRSINNVLSLYRQFLTTIHASFKAEELAVATLLSNSETLYPRSDGLTWPAMIAYDFSLMLTQAKC